MDAGDIGIIIAITLGFLAILFTMWGQSRQTRADVQRLSDDIERLRSEFGHRLSDVELEQARLEGVNSILTDVLKQQSHTHENTDD